jgi:hypothetical protein
MEDILIQRANTYASRYQLQLGERLGFGVHGIIFATRGKPEKGGTAIKVHKAPEPFQRERAVYERLRDADIRRILGFNVPRLVQRRPYNEKGCRPDSTRVL